MRKLWIATLAAAVLCASQSSALNTRKDWDGSTLISTFGCPDTTTYGQVITIPKGKGTLGNFSFFLASPGGGRLVIRGEVYQWDPVNSMATGSAVFESDPRVVNYKDTNFHRATFNANVSVTSGAQYILFASVDKDFDRCMGTLVWAGVPFGTYPGGHFYYLNDGGDSSEWTTEPWSSYTLDTAFTATLSNTD